MPSERDKLIYTVREQLRSDLLLGGKWLPKGELRDIDTVVAPEKQPEITVEKEPAPASYMTPRVEEIMNKKQKLKSLAAEVAACHSCSLSQTRTNVVPGEGNVNARLVFVGEAPGQSEDEQGRPFVGRAGKLLDNIIAAMGLTRDEVYICNILKCRPPDNRDPLMSEVEACCHFLHEQLNIIDPEVIVALGTHAAHTLLETTTPIGQLRGKMHIYHPSGLNKPIKLAATYHPAYLLRNYTPDTRAKVWDDMKKVLCELNMPVPGK